MNKISIRFLRKIKSIINNKIISVKNLHGNSHYVATGMAVGVFVAVIPIIPFHTVLALLLATVVRGSKAAAIVGVWVSNPFTIPILYIGSYKIGRLLLNREDIIDISNINSISDMFGTGLDLVLTMILGGIILGIIPSILAYALMRLIFLRMRKKLD